MFKPTLRVIVPNTDPRIRLLRIYVDASEEWPIVAWRIDHLEHVNPKDQFDVRELTYTTPIGVDEPVSNAIECIILPDGRAERAENCTYQSCEAAITACQEDLRRRGEK